MRALDQRLRHDDRITHGRQGVLDSSLDNLGAHGKELAHLLGAARVDGIDFGQQPVGEAVKASLDVAAQLRIGDLALLP